jgi:hypothetical protein
MIMVLDTFTGLVRVELGLLPTVRVILVSPTVYSQARDLVHM